MILSIPTKAKDKYIELCHEAYEVKTNDEFQIKRVGCESYSQAIRDICGDDVWYSIIVAADLSFPEDVLVCAGVPIYYKAQLIENH